MKQLLRFSLLILIAASIAQAREWPDVRAVQDIVRVTPSSVLDHGPFDDWIVFTSSNMDRPVLAFGPPISLNRLDPAGDALQLVQASTSSRAEFELLSNRAVGGLTRLTYRQLHAGMPVICGRADFTLNARGMLMRWSLRDYSDWSDSGVHALTVLSAARNVLSNLNGLGWEVANSMTAWLPDHDARQLDPVYWIWFAGPLPEQRWEAIVNAATGEIIFEWSGIHTDVVSAIVRGPYWQPYEHSPTQVGVHPYEMLTVNGAETFTDLAGEFAYEAGSSAELFTQLRGPFVLVENEDAPPGELALTVNSPFFQFYWDWQITDATRAELNLFHHTMFIHEWYKVIDPEFTALDYPLPAVCNIGDNYDNAYWNGFGTYYGAGSQYNDFAMFSDVIYHEYTHGVTDGIYPPGTLPYTGQPGAMNEAWSDYIACTINNDHLMGEWMLIGSPNSAFRNLESNMIFPQNWVGEVHGDSPFISAPLWTIRQTIGPAIADSIAHFARYALSETFFDYLVAVLETDDDDGDISNGTPHSALIYEAFGEHGIGPGDEPDFALEDVAVRADGQGQSIGDGDRFMEQGETAELTFALRNAAPLYPPPATDVQIAITTSDPAVSVSNGAQFVASLPAGASFELSPIILQLSSAATDHWIVINVDVTSNSGEFTYHKAIEFTLGTPHLLIVNDDPTSDVESYVSSTLRVQDRIYDQYSPEASESLPVDRYPGYGVIIWLSGNAAGNILRPDDQNRLTAYLEAGNKIILSGQNIVDDLSPTVFMQSLLQVQIQEDTVLSPPVTAHDSPFVDGDWFLTTGMGSAGNQQARTSFAVAGSSHSIAFYGLTGGPTAIVSFAEGDGLLFGFGIESISGMGGSVNRAVFMDRIYAWAGELLGTSPDQPMSPVPATYGISSVYPNPFNSSAKIQYVIPNGGGELFVYDLLGRVVEHRDLIGQTGTVNWSPAAASGIYFAQVKWRGGQSKPVKLLQVR